MNYNQFKLGIPDWWISHSDSMDMHDGGAISISTFDWQIGDTSPKKSIFCSII